MFFIRECVDGNRNIIVRRRMRRKSPDKMSGQEGITFSSRSLC